MEKKSQRIVKGNDRTIYKMAIPNTEKVMAYIVAVKSGTKSITRVGQHLVFETTKVFEVMPGFVTESDLRSCKTIAQLDELCNKYASPRNVIAIIDGDQFNFVCEHSTIVHTIYKSKLQEGLCPICIRELVDSNCIRCGLDWKTATNESVAKIADEYFQGVT